MAKKEQLAETEETLSVSEPTTQQEPTERPSDTDGSEKKQQSAQKNDSSDPVTPEESEETQESPIPTGPVTFAKIKEQSLGLKTKPHHMKLKKNGIVLYRGKEEGHSSDVNISYKNIVQLRFSKGETLRNGYLAFTTKDGATRNIHTLGDALQSRHAVIFSKKHNDEFRAFAYAMERFLKNMNPKFDGLVFMDREEGYESKRTQDQELKKKLAQYKKDGVIFCPKCHSLAYTKVHPAQKKGKLKHENELVRCKNCGHKWHVKPAKPKKEKPVEINLTDVPNETEE